jgi:hypothetical protein
MAYVRTVKTSSGAIAVQIVWSSRRGSRSIEHIGSAHDEAALAALKAPAAQRLAAGQAKLDLGAAGPTRFGAVADHLHAGSVSVGCPVPRLRRARIRPVHRRERSVSPTGARGSSNRPASKIRCACSTRPARPAPRIRRSTGDCRCSPKLSGRYFEVHALITPRSVRRLWRSTM